MSSSHPVSGLRGDVSRSTLIRVESDTSLRNPPDVSVYDYLSHPTSPPPRGHSGNFDSRGTSKVDMGEGGRLVVGKSPPPIPHEGRWDRRGPLSRPEGPTSCRVHLTLLTSSRERRTKRRPSPPFTWSKGLKPRFKSWVAGSLELVTNQSSL